MPLDNITNTNPKVSAKIKTKGDVQKCKQLINDLPRKIAFLYSNPQLSAHIRPYLLPLNALTREMRVVISLLNPFDFIIQPATTIENFKETLTNYKPEIVFWSGHTIPGNGELLFETEKGTAKLIEHQEFADILKNMTQLNILILMGCKTDKIAKIISEQINIDVICWSTITEDRAAASFTSGMVRYIQYMLDKNSEITAKEIYDKGLLQFNQDNFKEGDPEIEMNLKSIPTTHGIPTLILKK